MVLQGTRRKRWLYFLHLIEAFLFDLGEAAYIALNDILEILNKVCIDMGLQNSIAIHDHIARDIYCKIQSTT